MVEDNAVAVFDCHFTPIGGHCLLPVVVLVGARWRNSYVMYPLLQLLRNLEG